MEDIWEALAKALEKEGRHGCMDADAVKQIQQDPNASLELAIAAAAGASNRIRHDQLDGALACQEQARLWLAINDRVTAVLREARWDSERQPAPDVAAPEPNVPAEDATIR